MLYNLTNHILRNINHDIAVDKAFLIKNKKNFGHLNVTTCLNKIGVSKLKASPFLKSKPSVNTSHEEQQNEIFINDVHTSLIQKLSSPENIVQYKKQNTKVQSIRKEILHKIKTLLHKLSISDDDPNILFITTYMFDICISKLPYTEDESTIDSVAFGVLLLSLKFHITKMKMPLLSQIIEEYDKLNTNQNIPPMFSLDRVKITEKELLILIDYNLQFVHSIHFINLFLYQGLLLINNDKERLNKSNSEIKKIPNAILEKVVLFSNEYISFKPIHLACACIALAREISMLDKWPPIISNAIKVSYYSFEQAYKYIKDIYLNSNISSPIKIIKKNNTITANNMNSPSPPPQYRTINSFSNNKRCGISLHDKNKCFNIKSLYTPKDKDIIHMFKRDKMNSSLSKEKITLNLPHKLIPSTNTHCSSNIQLQFPNKQQCNDNVLRNNCFHHKTKSMGAVDLKLEYNSNNISSNIKSNYNSGNNSNEALCGSTLDTNNNSLSNSDSSGKCIKAIGVAPQKEQNQNTKRNQRGSSLEKEMIYRSNNRFCSLNVMDLSNYFLNKNPARKCNLVRKARNNSAINGSG